MTKPSDFLLLAAIVLVALYVGGGGAAKLAGIPYFHSSFPELGLPAWFGYLIGICEVLGAVALFVRPLSALAAMTSSRGVRGLSAAGETLVVTRATDHVTKLP